MSKLLYIDNFASLALSRAEADDARKRMLERLEAGRVVARVDSSSDAQLGFELADSGTCWWPSPKKFQCVALALQELAFGRCRRTGIQIKRALGRAVSLFGLRRARL